MTRAGKACSADLWQAWQSMTGAGRAQGQHLSTCGPVFWHITQQAVGNVADIEGCSSCEHEQGCPPQKVVHLHWKQPPEPALTCYTTRHSARSTRHSAHTPHSLPIDRCICKQAEPLPGLSTNIARLCFFQSRVDHA